MNPAVLRFDPTGSVSCLHTEAIDLGAIGRLEVVRATDLRFDPSTQQWEVRCPHSDRLLHSDPSRQACLHWEQVNLQPGSSLHEQNPPLP
jgi:hypothetical protein